MRARTRSANLHITEHIHKTFPLYAHNALTLNKVCDVGVLVHPSALISESCTIAATPADNDEVCHRHISRFIIHGLAWDVELRYLAMALHDRENVRVELATCEMRFDSKPGR